MYNGGYIDLTLLLTERSVEECCQLLGCHHHHHLTLHLNKSKPPCFNSALFDSQNNRNCRDYVQSCSRTAQSSAPFVYVLRDTPETNVKGNTNNSNVRFNRLHSIYCKIFVHCRKTTQFPLF